MSAALKLTSSKEATGIPGGTDVSALDKVALAAIEQGLWTVISYYSEDEKDTAIKIAKILQPSIDSIHEFDWERFIDVFGSKTGLRRNYSRRSHSKTSIASTAALATIYRNQKPQIECYFSSSDEDRLFRIGIIIGSAVALGEIAKLSWHDAKNISDIVGAPIGIGDVETHIKELE